MGVDPLDIAFRIEKQLGVELTREECVFMCDTAGWLHEVVCAKLDGRQPAVPDLWAVQSRIQNWLKGQPRYRRWRLTISSGRFADIVPTTELEVAWQGLSNHLGCELPSLEYEGGIVRPPSSCATVVDVARWVARRHPSIVPPVQEEHIGQPLPARANRSNAQVWEELRQLLACALGVDPHSVAPDARLIEDLGMS